MRDLETIYENMLEKGAFYSAEDPSTEVSSKILRLRTMVQHLTKLSELIDRLQNPKFKQEVKYELKFIKTGIDELINEAHAS